MMNVSKIFLSLDVSRYFRIEATPEAQKKKPLINQCDTNSKNNE